MKFHTVFWGERRAKFLNIPKASEELLILLERHSLPVFHVLLQDDQARSQEKEKDR